MGRGISMRRHVVFLKVAPVLLVLVSATFSVVSILNVDVRWGHMQAQMALSPLAPYQGTGLLSDEEEDSVGLRSIAFRMTGVGFGGDGSPNLRLRYAHSYSDLEEDTAFVPFDCRDPDSGAGGVDGECARVRAFVGEVQAVASSTLALIITAVIFNLLSFFMIVGSRLVRENKYTIHSSWILVLLAEVFYLAALLLWGVQVLNENIETNGTEITAGVGFGLSSISAIFNAAALIIQLIYLRMKAALEMSSAEAALHGSSAAPSLQSTARSGPFASSVKVPPPFEGAGAGIGSEWGAAPSAEQSNGTANAREDSYSAANPFDNEPPVAYGGAANATANGDAGDDPFGRRPSQSESVGLPPPPSTTIIRQSKENGAGGGGGAYGNDGDDLGW